MIFSSRKVCINSDSIRNSRKFEATITQNPNVILNVRILKCSMCDEKYRFFQTYEQTTEGYRFMKLGQDPSLATISQNKKRNILKLLSKYFSDLDRNEFNKALGLYAHGEGIAPLVFLRRIIERLVLNSFEENKIKFSWKDEDLPNRMLEKIEFLKEVIPSSLYDFRMVYSIMSKGLHELSEDDCRNAFPDVVAAIEYIVEDKARLEEQEKQRDELKQRIHTTASKVNQ